MEELNFDWLKFDHKYQVVDENQELEKAKSEWKEARDYFNSVSDPDLVDYAIYLMEATEKKYTYLLKQKKENSK